VKCHCGSLLAHGDVSVLSFHATKTFTTFEGGAIVCPDEKTRQRIDHLKNFGFVDEVTVVAPGINGKMSEFNAALGLLQLEGIDRALARRGAVGRAPSGPRSEVNGQSATCPSPLATQYPAAFLDHGCGYARVPGRNGAPWPGIITSANSSSSFLLATRAAWSAPSGSSSGPSADHQA